MRIRKTRLGGGERVYEVDGRKLEISGTARGKTEEEDSEDKTIPGFMQSVKAGYFLMSWVFKESISNPTEICSLELSYPPGVEVT